MLEGQVEVRDAGGTDGGHEPVGQVRRVQVQQADPVHQVGYRLDQRHDGPLALPLVAAVGGEVLGYQHHLAGVQGVHLVQDGGRRPAALRTTEGGDGAEPARPVAPLGDLHVGPRAGRCRAGQVQQVEGRELRRWGIGTSPEGHRHPEPSYPVDLRQDGSQLVAVPLGHAAGDHQASTVPLLVGQGQHGVDRLLAGIFDECAGVDHNQVGVGRLIHRRETVSDQHALKLVRVHLVLRAAQRDEVVGPFAHDWLRLCARRGSAGLYSGRGSGNRQPNEDNAVHAQQDCRLAAADPAPGAHQHDHHPAHRHHDEQAAHWQSGRFVVRLVAVS